MDNFLKKYNINLVRFMLLLPIILVAIISISHVVSWYNLSNPISWSIYLSVAVEIAAMVAIIASSLRIKGGAWGIFIIVTLIQMMGNIFYSYKGIDANGELFKSWMELTGPVWEMLGSKANDVIAMKRWLAFLEGGLLPVISLTSLHFFTKYDDGKSDKEEVKEVIKEVIIEKEVIKEVPVEVEKIVEVIKEVPVEVEKIVEKIIEVPVFQTETIEDEIYPEEDFDIIESQNGTIVYPVDENEYVSPGIDTHEPPRPSRLSYVKP